MRIEARLTGRTCLHFLHVSKTGGTAFKHALRGNELATTSHSANNMVPPPAIAFRIRCPLPAPGCGSLGIGGGWLAADVSSKLMTTESFR